MARKRAQLGSWEEIEAFHRGGAKGPDLLDWFGKPGDSPKDGGDEYEVMDSREEELPDEYQVRVAPTTNAAKPRAKKVGYCASTQTLGVVFRDGTWWRYNNVPVEFWNDLKTSNSTGKYLKNSGLDSHDDMGILDPSTMSLSSRAMFNGA
jgi:hypothetical protein